MYFLQMIRILIAEQVHAGGSMWFLRFIVAAVLAVFIPLSSFALGGKEPTQKALSALIQEAKNDGAKVMFVQPQFPASAARTVAQAIGGIVVEIDALAPDWLDNMARIGATLRRAVP
jgi:hypothetical protein